MFDEETRQWLDRLAAIGARRQMTPMRFILDFEASVPGFMAGRSRLWAVWLTKFGLHSRAHQEERERVFLSILEDWPYGFGSTVRPA